MRARLQTAGLSSPERPSLLQQWLARALAIYLTFRTILLISSIGLTLMIISSLVGAIAGSAWLRVAAGVVVALVLPLVLQLRLRKIVARSAGGRSRLVGVWSLVGWNMAITLLLCLGFSDTTGQALRRRGDWFWGETDGWLPRRYRQGLVAASRWMERFDLPPEAQKLLAEAITPENYVNEPTMAPQPGMPASSPDRPAWHHSLGGSTRALPPNAACRFGARRPGPRPPECELGHCGVDLFQPLGSPIYATFEGTVKKVQRNAEAGGIAGKFIWLSHKGGAVVTAYVHLQKISPHIQVGVRVRGGEMIGRLGRTGIKRSLPHLHFGLAVRIAGRRTWVDPEPLLWKWRLPGEQVEITSDLVATSQRPLGRRRCTISNKYQHRPKNNNISAPSPT